MSPAAFYNEIDPYAAQWLRNLIAAGHIAPGVVDERSIEDIHPEELNAFTQCHFFAGIGAWSYALRLARWPDDLPVWTGSCPCQPFSAAGKGAGFDDERHLWPAFFHLIESVGPPIVFGEQVASKDGRTWLGLVHADLEGVGYSVGAADLCAAGVGAPHIRQRLYWVAESNQGQRRPGRSGPRETSGPHAELAGRSEAGVVADADQIKRRRGPNSERLLAHGQTIGRKQGHRELEPDMSTGILAHHHHQGLEVERVELARAERSAPERGSETGDLGYAQEPRLPYGGTGGFQPVSGEDGEDGELADPMRSGRAEGWPGAGNRSAPWSGCAWIPCRDGKSRPVEPGSFPLAHGAPARVGRLRAYGNAIVPQVAEAFIRSYVEAVTLREMLA